MKKIAFCCDGTWNHPKSKDSVSNTDTNVYKLYKALPTTATQSPRYDDGVGADTEGLLHFLGGAFGEGLFQKIREGYTKIAQAYQDGDAIYLFGFSRGAYTARSISGMLSTCSRDTSTSRFDCDRQMAAPAVERPTSRPAARKSRYA